MLHDVLRLLQGVMRWFIFQSLFGCFKSFIMWRGGVKLSFNPFLDASKWRKPTPSLGDGLSIPFWMLQFFEKEVLTNGKKTFNPFLDASYINENAKELGFSNFQSLFGCFYVRFRSHLSSVYTVFQSLFGCFVLLVIQVLFRTGHLSIPFWMLHFFVKKLVGFK